MPVFVTTSWDDGDPRDLRIAELLQSRGVRGTFYVPVIGYNGGPTLSPVEIRLLDTQGFEIGAHGMSHHTLPKFQGKELKREVAVCKSRLEDVLGEPVRMFSYPKGRYSARVVRALKDAGYEGARTTRMMAYHLSFDSFEMPTTLQVFPYRMSTYIKNIVRAGNLLRLCNYMIRFRACENWVDLGKRVFDRVLREGGVWHLVGHSWEIEQMELWDQLRDMLDYVSADGRALYVTNNGLLRIRNGHTPEQLYR
ncbi:MAG: polysaccharide deacetylase family protein [Syntrophobacteraceae bacterium]